MPKDTLLKTSRPGGATDATLRRAAALAVEPAENAPDHAGRWIVRLPRHQCTSGGSVPDPAASHSPRIAPVNSLVNFLESGRRRLSVSNPVDSENHV